MTKYERHEYDEIVAWKESKPTMVEQAVGFVFKPASWLIATIVPQKAIEGCLIAFDKAANFLTDTADVVRDGAVSDIKDLQRKDLRLSDELADGVHNWALLTSGAEGAVAGSAGLVGMAVDIPSLITMCLRVVHKIGVCYGFEVNSNTDRNFVFGVLSAASANTMKEKVVALGLLQKINVMVATTAWKKLATDKAALPVVIVAIKNLAKQMGVNLTKRKVAQAIPIIGAGVGAAVNVAFINDVAWAARRMYQERWLLINGKATSR